MSNPSKHTSGVVLKVVDYGESDTIVTLFCPDVGKFTGIAKGAKRSKKRFVNKLELFSQIDFHYNTRYQMAAFEQAELVNGFIPLREDYQKYCAAVLISELMLYWSSENDGDELLYTLLIKTLASLSFAKTIKKTLVLFLVKLYSRLGYQPCFSSCKKCGRQDQAGIPYQFNCENSSIICNKCDDHKGYSSSLSLTTIKLLEKAQELPFDKTDRLQFTDRSLQEAITIFRRYSTYLLDRDIHSWSYIK